MLVKVTFWLRFCRRFACAGDFRCYLRMNSGFSKFPPTTDIASSLIQSSTRVVYTLRKSVDGTRSPWSRSAGFVDGYSPYCPPFTLYPMTRHTPPAP